MIEYNRNHHHLGDWDSVATYTGRYYGPEGNDLGTIPISVAPVLDPYTYDTIGWVVAETPEEDTIFHGTYQYEAEAIEAAKELAEELDETLDLQSVIDVIKESEYFDNPDVVPDVVAAMSGYSQGYLLVTSDIGFPVGTRWTTNGYLQCTHLRLPATFETEEQAAEYLLRAITGDEPKE